MFKRLKRSVVLGTVLALVVNGLVVTGLATPAHAAADADVAGILTGLDKFGTFTKDLAGVGAFGQALPLVQLTPAGDNALKFADAFGKSVHDPLAGKEHLADLAGSYPLNLGDGRTGTLTVATTAGSVESVTTDLTLNRTASATLHVSTVAPRVDLSVPANVTLTLTAHLVWTYDQANSVFALQHAAGSPSIGVTAHATLAPSGDAAIGIMGVTIQNTSNFTLDVAINTFVDDPNGDGHLAFTETGGAAGELSAAGAAAALFHPSLSSPAGSASGHVDLLTKPLTGFAADGLAASVTVSWQNVGIGAPIVTAQGLDPLARFQFLSAKDLSDGIKHLADTVTALQRAKFSGGSGALGDVNLPFMKGSVADAVSVAEALVSFVTANTQPATAGTGVAGQPKFASVQAFLSLLNGTTGPGGSTLDVSDTVFNPDTNKLSFTLDLARTAADTPLNQPSVLAANSGDTVTYGATTLTDTAQSFAPNSLQGRLVKSGANTATVASNTATVLTLTGPWSPAVPNPHDAYVVQSADPKTGEVQFGNVLNGAGIAQANAVSATATVRPAYDAHLGVVLDLQDPKTGSACAPATDPLRDPADASTGCPYKRKNLDGSLTVIDEQPTNVDRIQLRTGAPLLSAGLRVDTSVSMDVAIGFLQVHLGGTLRLCSRSVAGTDCAAAGDPSDMVSLSLKPLGDLPLDQVFARLAQDPTSLLTGDLSARAFASLTATVPGPGGGSFPAMTGSIAMDDIRQPANLTTDVSAFDPVKAFNFNPDNPTQMLGQILKALQLISDQMDNLHASGPTETLLGTKIPVVGKTLRDLIGATTTSDGSHTTYTANGLTDSDATFDSSVDGHAVIIGTYVGVVTGHTDHGLTLSPAFTSQPADHTPYAFRSELADAIDKLADPPDNLQDLVTQLNAALGPDSPVTIGFDSGTPPKLIFDVDWKQSTHTDSAVSFNLADAGIPQDVIGAQVDGTVHLSVNGEAKLRLLMPLQAGDGPAIPADLMVDRDPSHTSITLGVQADANAFDVTANIGPLALSLGQPDGSDKAQAHAKYGVSLTSPGGGQVSLATFLSGLSAGIDTSTTAVTCGTGVEQANMALCAHLPLYVNSGGGWTKIDPTDYSINVRLPRTSDLSDAFSLTGAQVDGADRLQLPADLASKIANAVLDFGALNDGLDRYLAMLEAGLRLASANGKLPLIGDDVQKGADFIGDVRAKFQSALGSASGINSFDSLSSWGSTTLSNALGFPVQVDARCSYTMHKATNVAVSVQGTAGSTSYTYAVIARQGSTDTAVSDPSPPVTGPDTLDGTNFNRVTWTAVVGADSYRVVRKNGSAWDLVGTVTGNGTATFDDKGAAVVQAGYPTTDTEATVTTCATGVGADALTGVDFTVDIKNNPGVTFAPGGGCASNCTSLASVPLDIGIPGLSMSANGDTANDKKISVDVGWAIHLKFGLNKDSGFVIYTKDGAQPTPELQVGLGLKLPTEVVARVAFLQAKISNHNAGNPLLFGGTFGIDLKKDANAHTCWTFVMGDPDCATAADGAPITLGDLADITDHVSVALVGGVHIDWNFDATIDPALPGLTGEFKLDWTFTAGDAPDKTTDLSISFPLVQLDVGKFLESLLGPIFDEIKTLTGPLQPIIDTLYAPIPVLSDLSHMVGGPDVTLVSIAKAFSTIAGGPDLEFVDKVLAAVQLANKALGGGGRINLGSFDVSGSAALSHKNTPDAAPTLITNANANANAKTDLDNASNPDSKGVVTGGGQGNKAGFAFPLLDDPKKAFGLLMGQDVDLVTFDSGPLALAFSYSQAFGPVYAPPPVLITISGSASVSAHIKAGFDTFGLRKAVEAKKVDIGILDSLYLGTRNDDGTTLQVVSFSGSIGAGAQVSVLILTVGVEGGITLTVSFSWNDPTPTDGKFRFGEFAAVALNNPICLFNVSGKLSLYLKVYITIGVSIFSVSFDITLANITLLDFSVTPDCTPPPPVLGQVQNGVLLVHAGRLATDNGGGQNLRGNHAYDPIQDPSKASEAVDKVVVTELHDWTQNGHPFIGFAVSAAGDRQEFSTRTGYTVDRVLVDGHGFAGALNLTFQGDGDTTKTDGGDGQNVAASPFDKDVVVFGGEGPDVIRTGQGRSYIDGGGGDDQITTSDVRPLGLAAGSSPPSVAVAGGPGKDQITVGGGDDWVAGDASLTWTGKTVPGKSVQAFDWTTDFNTGPAKGSTADAAGDRADTISVGLGHDTVYGGGDSDIIGVATDNPLSKNSDDPAYRSRAVTVVGGGGGDKISAGSGDDFVYTGDQVPTTEDGDGTGDVASDVNVVDTGTGNDTVYGGQGQDNVAGHSTQTQVDKEYGGKGRDTLSGGFGQDQIFGGPDEDTVLAEPSTVDGGVASLLPLPAGVTPQHKLLVGGDQNDVIYGGNGGADIFGDRHESACTPPNTDPESDPPGEAQSGTPGADTIFGGSGVDVVAAGGQNDVVYAYAGNDLVCGQSGNDVLYLGNDDDRGYGGTGDDVVLGDDGNDRVYGNDGQDTLYGGDGTDILEGNDGADTESGGAGNDLVVGGTRAAGRQDRGPAPTPQMGDTLFGDTGDDTLIGDNGVGAVGGAGGGPAEPRAYDLDGANPNYGAQDTIYGGDDNDRAFGGLDNDFVNGGNGDDWLEGDNGADHVNGDAGEDRLLGGGTEQASPGVGRPDSGDIVRGGDGPDLIVGDNAVLTRHASGSGTPVTLGRGFFYGYDVTLLDLGLTPTAGTSGDDDLGGDGGNDVIYGEGGRDRVHGDNGDDAVEGDQGVDWVEGDLGNDDLVGGSTTPLTGTAGTDTTTGQLDDDDAIWGGPGDDVAIGDNGAVLRTGASSRVTVRTGSDGALMTPRQVQLFDQRNGGSLLTAAPVDRSGSDRMSGGAGNDLLFGQDETDYISGGGGADYLEGDGGTDVLRGDLALTAPSSETVVSPLGGVWPGAPATPDVLEGAQADGQDDIVGGSTVSGFRDGGDAIEGDGADDAAIGDNGRLVRTPTTIAGVLRDQPYVDRYPTGALPADATTVRTSGVAGVPTRYCVASGTTCEPAGSFGNDSVFGDGGNDGLWGQDGNDVIRGGDGNDDIFGELGDDTLFGDAGEDAILGDRGGVVDNYLDASDVAALGFTVSTTSPPAESYTGFRLGSYDRRVDLRHDTDGPDWIGSSTSAAMPHNGMDEGGNDSIRGGLGADSIHAGFGDDLANGDSGGDQVFGDDGADVLWGGKGCDPVADAATPDCLSGGVFDPTARGTNDRFVDHVFGGVGGTSAASLAGDLGSDLLDFDPRGSYTPGTGCTTNAWPQTTGNGKNAVTVDPCAWFVMTDKADDTADPATLVNNQHHQGTDWLYGGWDRDILQGDLAANGPNPGDRLLDWTGAYNLYSHCPAAYGGYNDVRLFSPDMQTFLQKLAWGSSAGRGATDVTTAGTSAFRELALVYTGDINTHGAGSAYPGTPGHFDDPAACTS